MAERRLGQKTRFSTEERNAGCREWLCYLYREWLLSELSTDTSRKHKQTIWHTVWNDGLLDSIAVGFNPLNAELNPICHLLALLAAHPIPHISRIRVKECCVSNSMNSQWKIMKKTHLFVIECWQWLVNWVMMCVLGYSSYSDVFTVMFI